MPGQPKADGVRRVLGKDGRVHVTLAAAGEVVTFSLDDAAAETLTLLLAGALRDTRSAGYDPTTGTLHEPVQIASITPELTAEGLYPA